MSEEAVDTKCCFNLFPSLIFASIVGGECVHCKIRQSFDHGVSGCLGCFVFHLCHEENSTFSFKQCVHSRRVIFRLDHIALPVANTRPQIDNRGTLFNGRPFWLEDTDSFARAVMMPSLLLAPQVYTQIFFARLQVSISFAIYLRIYELVYGFVGDGTKSVLLEASGDLLWRPVLLQVVDDR